ncbi:MAG: glycosyl hydrolase [Hellea sp.]|nr:glycosyl hydrolase [Hellea sp.]
MRYSDLLKISVFAGSIMMLGNCGGGSSSNPAPIINGGNGGSGNGGGSGGGTIGPTITLAQNGDILVNQHGYQTQGQKLATLISDSNVPLTWQLLDSADRLYASGQTMPFGPSPLSGLNVHHIDFSNYARVAPDVRLEVGGGESHAFNIANRPFRRIANDAAKYFYYNRAGSSVSEPYTRLQVPSLTRQSGHDNLSLSCFSGADLEGNVWPACNYSQSLEGGWYDAGDYGLYAINTGVTVWALQNLFESMEAQSGQCSLMNGAAADLNIPESADGLHDILNEARIGMELLLSLQVIDTAPVGMALGDQSPGANLTITAQDASGMVHHKAHGESWPADSAAPADDIQTWYFFPPSTAASLHLAATGAQCARIWRHIDSVFADRCLAAAITAYSAAQATPDAYAYDNFDGGGPYEDVIVTDEFSWAATELYITTQDISYLNDVLSYTLGGYYLSGRTQPSWRDTEALGMLSLATQIKHSAHNIPADVETEIVGNLVTISNFYQRQSNDTGFNVPDDDSNYYWGSNSNLLLRAILLATTSDISPNNDYQDEVLGVMNYLLGNNPLGQSYITGYGDQAMENPHHRFWSNSIDIARPSPPPGVLSGGPNNTAMVDPISRQLDGTCRAQTCWIDDYEAYTFNEVTISYNAGLVWTAHWLDDKARCNN